MFKLAFLILAIVAFCDVCRRPAGAGDDPQARAAAADRRLFDATLAQWEDSGHG